MKRFLKTGNDSLPEDSALYRKLTIVRMWRMDEVFECESREGMLTGLPGDFLAADGDGGFYPVSAIFHANNYEEVKE